ncbi:MAG: MATE family efflux transporter [Lachnospiraceae bacterium]|nr:MATE family efflux transporter [Lachnospiraceae bacterium]
MKNATKITLEKILTEEKGSRADEIRLVLSLSLPAILAQLTSIAMQYIDAGMVGSLGAGATASIGLISTTTWLIGGTCIGVSAGFYVQVAQLIGARRNKEAADVLRQGLKAALTVGLLVSLICILISGKLPIWLGGSEDIVKTSSTYFFIYSLAIPFSLIRQLSGGMMQSTGDMKTPSILSGSICILNVIFNFFFIFPTRTVEVFGLDVKIFGFGLGVAGAAIATTASDMIISLIMLFMVCFKNKKIALCNNKGSWKWQGRTIANAAKIVIPLSLDQFFMCSAYVAGTVIIAPLGTVSVAANSLSVTAESLCYMPGYGIGSAATAIIGQTIGADRKDLTKSFSRTVVCLGMGLMGLTAIFMYFFAPIAFSFLTSDPEVAALGTKVLRLELIAEPLYGASICCAGIFRGAGDTLKPSILNLVSMWGVRILLAALLVPHMGLMGYWTAMAIELCFRGIIFLIRLYRGKWLKKSMVA